MRLIVMKLPSYLQRNRYGIFYFRRVLPKDVRDVFGKVEFIRSLKTYEPKIAIQYSRLYAHKLDLCICELRKKMATTKKKGIQLNYHMKFDPETNSQEFTASDKDIEQLKEAGLSPKEISEHLLAMSEQLAKTAASNTQEKTQTKSPLENDIKLSELILKFNQDRVDSKGGKWEIPSNDKTRANRLIELLGDISISELNRDNAREVRTKLMLLPSNSRQYRDMPIEEVLSIKHEKTLSTKTIKDHMEFYVRLFTWAKREDYFHKEMYVVKTFWTE